MKIFARLYLTTLSLVGCIALAQQPTQDQTQKPASGGGREFRGVVGLITEISGSTLKIKLPNGSVGTVNTNSNTRFRKDQSDAKLSDFKVGETVMVRGDSTGESTWTAQMIGAAPSQTQMQERMKEAMGKTMVIGEVKSIDAPKLTVQRIDGVEQSIEADESTSFRKGRDESITLPDIKVGDTIFARGELKNAIFVPSDVTVIPPEMARRMKEGGGMGFGGGGDRRNRVTQQPNSGKQSSPGEVPKQ